MRRYGGRKRRFGRGRKRTLFRRRGSRYLGRTIRRTVNRMAETKFNIITITGANVIASPNIGYSWVDNISAGITSRDRIGNKIQCMRISFDFHLSFIAVANSVPGTVCRILVMYPRKGISGADMNSYMVSAMNNSFRPLPERYYVLYDKTFLFNSGSDELGSGGAPAYRRIRFSKRSRYIFNYSSTPSVDREPMVYLCSNLGGTASDSQLVLTGTVSCSFKDL